MRCDSRRARRSSGGFLLPPNDRAGFGCGWCTIARPGGLPLRALWLLGFPEGTQCLVCALFRLIERSEINRQSIRVLIIRLGGLSPYP
jgi:hypothetical protein